MTDDQGRNRPRVSGPHTTPSEDGETLAFVAGQSEILSKRAEGKTVNVKEGSGY